MSLITYNCPQCVQELQFLDTAQQVTCPQCQATFAITQFESVVVLKAVLLSKATVANSKPSTLLPTDSPITLASLNQQLALVKRTRQQHHQVATASLAVAFLFGCFALASLLVDRGLITLFCTMITTTLLVAAIQALRQSSRSRDQLTRLQQQRDALGQQIRPQIPRIF
jgi:hypothetical protein